MFDSKQSTVALGVTAGLGIGFLLGKTQPLLRAKPATGAEPAAASASAAAASEDEVQRLIRPNILALTPYRCARDDYDQGNAASAPELDRGSSS